MTEQGQISHPGVYFGLSESAYRNDLALGSTDIRTLLRSPPDYWWGSAMNPLREPEEETPALLYGRALHKLVLEGTEAFANHYCAEPDKRDYPEALVTVAHLEAFLAAHEIKKPTRAKKEDLEALARPHGAVIWSDLLRQATLDARERTLLKPRMHAEVIMAGAQIAKNEKLREAFRGGRSEVSVFWERNGIRRKARFDYLKLRSVIDLKSFRPKGSDAPPHIVVRNAIASFRYDIQAAHYLEAREAAGRFIASGAIQGAAPAADWLAAVAAEQQFAHWLVFYQAESAPVVILRSLARGSPMVVSAMADVERACQAYRDHLAKYGTDCWGYEDPMLDPEVTLDCMPKWFQAELVS
jgi:hypothetical protein